MRASSLLLNREEGSLTPEDLLKLTTYLMKMHFSLCSNSVFMYTHFFLSSLPITLYLLPLCLLILAAPSSRVSTKGTPFHLCSVRDLKPVSLLLQFTLYF